MRLIFVIPELVSGICFNLVCTIDCRASHSNDVWRVHPAMRLIFVIPELVSGICLYFVIPELVSGICFNLVGTIDCRAAPSNDGGKIVIPELVSGIYSSANNDTIFKITLVAASILSKGTNSNFPWKLCPPAKILGQGRPINESLAPSVPPLIGWM